MVALRNYVEKRRCTIAGITVHLLFWSQMLIISRMYDDDQVVDCAEKSYADAVRLFV